MCTRAINQCGQAINVLVSILQDAAAARRFFTRALNAFKAKWVVKQRKLCRIPRTRRIPSDRRRFFDLAPAEP